MVRHTTTSMGEYFPDISRDPQNFNRIRRTNHERDQNKEFREESPLKYKPIWVRPEVYEVLKKECKYQGTFMGRFTERCITECVNKNIYSDPFRKNPEYNKDSN